MLFIFSKIGNFIFGTDKAPILLKNLGGTVKCPDILEHGLILGLSMPIAS